MNKTTTADESRETTAGAGVPRRTVLKASAVAAGALGLGMPVDARFAAKQALTGPELDSHEGFSVELLAGHATFTDDVSATFRMKYDGGDGSIVSNLPRDASSVIFARVTWEPAGTSGWHTHPGPVIVSIVEGELELVNERDCVVRTYAAGEAFVDPGQGNIHIASNPSGESQTVAYATFLGVPQGEPATLWVPPVDCGTVGHRFAEQ